MLNINKTIEKAHTVTEHQYGDTIFTVMSVESQRARETLYEKMKRMILTHPLAENEKSIAA